MTTTLGVGLPNVSSTVKHSPRRQLFGPWSSIFSATAFLIVTAIYASQYPLASSIRFICNSPSNTIFVLSLLSGVGGFLLSISIDTSIDFVKWMLMQRPKGLQLSTFLALDAGTGKWALVLLVISRGIPLFSPTRACAAIRLLATVLVPALGVIIMSNVNTQMTFHTLSAYKPVPAWGISEFNGTLASNISIFADQVVQAQMDMFLSDTSRAVDITPPNLRAIPCTYSPSSWTGKPCERAYFMAGVGYVPPILNDSLASTTIRDEVILTRNQQGYTLEYKEQPGNMTFDRTSECSVYGFPFAALALCLRNEADHILHAQIVQCPTWASSESSCFKNNSWYGSLGYRTLLTMHFRNASVAYSLRNGSIISYEFSKRDRVPAPAFAADMLQAYRDGFGNFSTMERVLSLLTDGKNTDSFAIVGYPAVLSLYFKGASKESSENPAVQNKAVTSLQCFLAIILYHCHNNLVARFFYTKHDREGELAKWKNDSIAMAPPQAEAFVAVQRFQIVVGRDTLIAWLCLTGVALLTCTFVLSVVSFSSLGKETPRLSGYPFLDATARSCDADGGQLEFGKGKLRQAALTGMDRNRVLFREIENIKLKFSS